MDFKKIEREMSRFKAIVEGWQQLRKDEIASMERDLALDHLKAIYELVRFDGEQTAETDFRPVATDEAGVAECEAEEKNSERVRPVVSAASIVAPELGAGASDPIANGINLDDLMTLDLEEETGRTEEKSEEEPAVELSAKEPSEEAVAAVEKEPAAVADEDKEEEPVEVADEETSEDVAGDEPAEEVAEESATEEESEEEISFEVASVDEPAEEPAQEEPAQEGESSAEPEIHEEASEEEEISFREVGMGDSSDKEEQVVAETAEEPAEEEKTAATEEPVAEETPAGHIPVAEKETEEETEEEEIPAEETSEPEIEPEKEEAPVVESEPESEIEEVPAAEPEKGEKGEEFVPLQVNLFGQKEDDEHARRHRHKQRVIMSLYDDDEPRYEESSKQEADFVLETISVKGEESRDDTSRAEASAIKESAPEKDEFEFVDLDLDAEEEEEDEVQIVVPQRDSIGESLAEASDKPVLGEVIRPHTETLGDRFVPQQGLGDKLRHKEKGIGLEDGIGVNDKFLLIRDLFNNDVGAYNQVIHILNHFEALDDCLIYIAENYTWNPNSEGAKLLMELLERKFDK